MMKVHLRILAVLLSVGLSTESFSAVVLNRSNISPNVNALFICQALAEPSAAVTGWPRQHVAVEATAAIRQKTPEASLPPTTSSVSTLYGVARGIRLQHQFIRRMRNLPDVQPVVELFQRQKASLWAFGMYFNSLSAAQQKTVKKRLDASSRSRFKSLKDLFTLGGYFSHRYSPRLELSIVLPDDDALVDPGVRKKLFERGRSLNVIAYAVRPDHESSIAALIDMVIAGSLSGTTFSKGRLIAG